MLGCTSHAGGPPMPMILTADTKRPAVKWTPFKTTPAAESDLPDMFFRYGVNGVALIAGPVSGDLAIRDFDSAAAYRRWQDAKPKPAATLPTVKTVNGFHVYARSDLAKIKVLGNGECRGGGITVAPYSMRG